MLEVFPSKISAAFFYCLFIVLVFFEIWIIVKSGKRARSLDRGSVVALNVCFVLVLSIDSMLIFSNYGVLPPTWRWASWLGISIFIIGIILRWTSIYVLGQYFTGRVQIQAEHKIVIRGPYRWIRHPSYTGGILIFIGIAIAINDWVAFIINLLFPLAAYIYRIRVEEKALLDHFGDAYAEYKSKTWSLVPFIRLF